MIKAIKDTRQKLQDIIEMFVPDYDPDDPVNMMLRAPIEPSTVMLAWVESCSICDEYIDEAATYKNTDKYTQEACRNCPVGINYVACFSRRPRSLFNRISEDLANGQWDDAIPKILTYYMWLGDL